MKSTVDSRGDATAERGVAVLRDLITREHRVTSDIPKRLHYSPY